ncbi:RNA 2',3'-cyclic phosphodiesterase [Rhodobacter sp. TJ_12]|uniref:RNA 2',3'-cyclic phosphodiesterase n=1 Tax=Rhodobacter sp. TJ_12 TaxID=2029399 RepID=UPI001CBFDA45|nr:RNA 2',3'-cyclic phosphodiesterase [Rhodobacter sp. TJ_12]MBZ4024026.1 RNA 2',3'-cyclic phosphodiesterase [Rhodobacter sp. TJ_12]
MRIFVGVMLAEALWAPVARLQAELGCGRAVDEENLHLTLAFLGDLDLPELDLVHEELSALTVAPFTVALAGLDPLGGADRVETLVLNARPNPALEALQAKVAQAVRRAGVALERRRFRPHVTIARFGKGFGPGAAAKLGALLQARGDVVLPEWRVAGFSLIHSHLGRDGASYEVLADYPEI